MLSDDCRKRLTEFLFGKDIIFEANFFGFTGKGDMREMPTFTTEADMMSLYRRLWETGKYWPSFHDYAVDVWSEISPPTEQWDCFTAWLFCLSGDGYEERCQMVAEFLEVEK